ncbi:intermembrane lipid transfer protein Vps13 isoform X2 [Ostrinia nubilalis]|uniref:intermembrane lipid transfer protein Vps13 isoform X1 n=1 Tax=Ostrinia nubilalis TaxID=29057 RepID=UPI0030822BB9
MKQRPSANALRVDVQMQAFTVTGVQQGDFEPQLVVSKEVTKDVNLLNVIFEKNPLDGACDQRVKVSARPLQIVYDAQTVIEIVNVFKPPSESTALTTLQAAAGNKLTEMKEKSALGMQYAVHHHTFIDLDVDIAASYIIVPQTGKYKGDEACVVVKLGAISVKSEPRAQELDVRKLYKEGLADEDILKAITHHSYDKMALELTEMQIVIATSKEDWQSAIVSNEATPLHLLQPTNLVIQIHKCLITDDPRLPKIKVRGELQKIAISASEDRLLTLCEIIVSMPLPNSEEAVALKPSESKGSSLSLLRYLDPAEKQKRDIARSNQRDPEEQSLQLTEVDAVFIMKELVLSVNRKTLHATNGYDKFLVFSLNQLKLTVVQKTFNLDATVRLGAVNMQHHRAGYKVINMIETPDVLTEDKETPNNQYLFAVTYSNVDKKCPEFRSIYGSVEQLIDMDFTNLKVLLHLQGLQEILVIVNEYQTRLQAIQSTVDRTANAGPLETIMEDEEFIAAKSKVSVTKPSRRKQVESIQLKVNIKIGAIEIGFANNKRPLSVIQVTRATTGLVMKTSYTQVDCAIGSIKVEDLNPDTIHREILKVISGDVMNVQIVMYNLDQYPSVSDVNISIDAQINCLRIIFLNWFVSSMLEFLNNFQTAQQAIIDASSQAADAARANVQNAYQNSTKLALKVRLAAPIIIVPENSHSLNAMLVDLGRMSLNNKFVDLPVADVSNKVTVDELTLELEDMKLSCVQLNEELAIQQERKLLRPTSFKLFVKRSLSAWYETLPDLDISGRMKTIAITVGHSDYKSIMKILNQNLQEGQTKSEESKPKQDVSKVVSKATVKSQTSKVQTKSTVAVVTSKDAKKPRTTIKFSFTMDSFVIDLMNTISSEDAMFSKDIELARFCLALLSVKGRMFSDNSMHTSVLLVDCTLDDTRPGRGAKITRYLERRRERTESRSEYAMDETRGAIMEAHDKIRSMIDITYTMKNSDTFIDMRIFSFNLILAMDFLNKIMEFLTVGLAADAPAAGKPKEDLKVVKSVTDKSGEGMSKKKLSVVSAPSLEQPQKTSMMTVNVKIEQPDIILVESLEQKKCDALVLNMEARFKLRTTEERMVADGGISGLQMVVRTLGAPEGNAPRYLLAPANLSLALSQPPGSGMHADISVSDIKLTVSPDIIALLNRVLATITSSDENETEQEQKAIYYKDLWNMQPFRANSYWFLKTDEAEEAINLEAASTDNSEEPAVPTGEICLLSSPSIVVSLEMDIGTETIPVLVMQASLTGQLKDWSSDFYMESTWAMQVSYYNIGRAVWEPLIEPVEVLKDYQYKHVPWELKMEVVMRTQENVVSIDTTDEAANIQAVALRQANKTITISSSEPLEITITRSGMEVLTQLGNSFSAAIAETDTASVSKSKVDGSHSKYFGAPYVLHNCTGLTAKLMLQDNHDFSVFLTDEYVASDYREVVLEPNACVPLQLKHGGLNLMKLNEPPPPLKLNVKIVEMNEEVQIPVERADKRYFTLGRKPGGTLEKNVPHVAAIEPRGLISDIVMQEAALHIYLRSVVQVTNTLAVNVSVYYMTLSGNEVRLLGDVKPGGILRMPLQAVHTPTAEIFFSVEGFTVSVSPFIWRELQQEVKISKLLQCDSKDKNSGEKFYLKAIGTMEQVFYEHTNRHTFASSCYDIVLKPAVKLQNCLPVDIVVSQLGLKRTQIFKPGEMFHLSHLAPNRASVVLMIQNYLDKCWVCTKNLPELETELSVWTFDSHDSPSLMTLDLGMHSVDMEGTQVLSLYCPFWMLNKTGFTLHYRIKHSRCGKFIRRHTSCLPNLDETGNVICHPKEYKEPILFSFRAKNFFGKKKAAIRVEFGEWSDKFPLDVPGSSGLVLCKHEGRTYQVAVTNQLTFNSLTKMVVFTPFFLIINEAPFAIQYQELHRSGDPWKEVDQNSSAPLWPVIDKEDKLLLLRVSGSTEHAAPFLYTEQHSVCLKLNNDYGGLHVEVQLSEGGTYITVRQYRDGHAPALLVNFTRFPVVVYEKENVNVKKLESMHKMLFTWDNPAGPRSLIFEGYKKKEIENDLRKDGIGDFMINETNRVSWVSFLDGLQRVILFTDDPNLASGAHTIGEAEFVDTEIVLSMQGMGLSLVNDPELLEIVYISISNSGIIWEQCKIGARRYKKIDGAKLALYEDHYQQYLIDKMASDEPIPPCRMIDEKTEVNFEEMRIVKPNPRLLRRTLQAGLWASYGLTAHSRRLHARLHRLQIDQQLPLPTFPVVLAPVPPPRSIANEGPSARGMPNIVGGMKPFIEVSIVERIMEHSKVRQYKYYKVLIQEFHVKVDMGLVNALMGMFPQRVLTEQEALDAFELDLEKAGQPLEALAALGVASDQKNFYDNLHLSPLKVHVSFSLGGATQLPTFIGTVLQSIGVTLTDMNDVVFKLSYYERNYEFLSQKELISQAQSHYTGQALKQLYVLVLGLDVIGNPYGLVIGLKKGVEDLFYEPFQGAIQGPGEFAEGLFLGVRSLVGHTVGGAAGAVSRITGAMGHGLAALSLDKDYQRRRRDNINKPPANLQEGLARSGKGLVMGVFDGVTGVFTKPFEGARDEGVEGFFKGLGRGAVGLVARPTAGVVDFASGSLDAVKRAADLSEEVTKRRAARYLPADSGVRPYSRLHAEGYKMLFELEKGKFVSTDTYEAHVWVIPAKEVVMCTDKRLLYLEKNNVFGGWQIVWSYLWSEIPDVPTAANKGVYIPTAKKKVLGMFPSSGSGKLIFLYDEQQKKYLLAQCERLMRSAR